MLKSDAEFNTLMQDVLNGSEAAAEELFRDYEPCLLRAIRLRLSRRIRSKFDSTDFVQEVWASFFAHEVEERIFDTPADLVAFLTRLAQNKVIDTTRQRLKTQKYDVTRERSLDDSKHFDKEGFAGNDPTPSQMVMSEEEWSEFLRKQPLVYRRIFSLLRQGKTAEEIALELHIHPRTVRRAMCRIVPGWRS